MSRHPLSRDPLRMLIAGLAGLWLACLAWSARLPGRGDVLPAMAAAPLQRATFAPPFVLSYRGVDYDVRPVAEYELHGLVVSHNDIDGIADIYHDEDALDTRDLCVVWGGNAVSGSFRAADYHSTPHFCFAQWGAGAALRMDEFANNHLITDSQLLRDRLATVRTGDQVRVRGLLVDYRDPRHPEFWRKSSTVRTDDANGACEVLFFNDLQVLRRHAPVARALLAVLPWVIGALVLLQLWRWSRPGPQP